MTESTNKRPAIQFAEHYEMLAKLDSADGETIELDSSLAKIAEAARIFDVWATPDITPEMEARMKELMSDGKLCSALFMIVLDPWLSGTHKFQNKPMEVGDESE